jgi:hypothetical protein
LTDADFRCEVDDLIYTLQSFDDRCLVSHITNLQLHVACKIDWTLPAWVDLFNQIVEHAHTIAALNERFCKVAADEAGAAGDQDVLSHDERRPKPGRPAVRLTSLSKPGGVGATGAGIPRVEKHPPTS